jgi:uncharacterized membrane protein (UPF0127 family)
MLGFIVLKNHATPALMRLVIRSAQILLLAALPACACTQPVLPLAELGINAQRVKAEVARTPAARQTGLMHRKALPAQRGMLFVYPRSNTECMWMKNTLIPLSVAFIDAQGRILNIADMQPNTRDYHCSQAPAQYALEMNLGWFQNHGIKTGDKVTGLAHLMAEE